MNDFLNLAGWQREILRTPTLLILIEDFRVLENGGFQFLVVYYEAGSLKNAVLLLGNPQDWCAGILAEKRNQGVEVVDPMTFSGKKDFEQYVLTHPVLRDYHWDWSQIAEKVRKSF